MTITTNNHRRDIYSLWSMNLRAPELKKFLDDHDYIDWEANDEEAWHEERWVKAYGSWHDINDVQLIESSLNPSGMRRPFSFVVDPEHELHGWTAISTESHWSAIVFKLVEPDWQTDEHTMIVGYWTGQ